LEIGCQEGIGTVVVAKEVESLVAVDFYKPYIDTCLSHVTPFVRNIQFSGHDIIGGPVDGEFDAAYALDVFEHIDPDQEDIFMRNIVASLTERATFIVGIPSLESQEYASAASRKGHINCKNGDDLRLFCQNFFHNVFMFGMNDEVLHTGYMPMCHYLFALCVGRR
jgi:cyclopropane fatty-acyl-phospholipid synthase-like methyltransferase